MKQVGTTHWVGNNNHATNSSGLQLFRRVSLRQWYLRRERGGRSLVEFNSGQRNQRRVLVCEFSLIWIGGATIRPLVLSVRCLRD
jgi:hypothetical protein